MLLLSNCSCCLIRFDDSCLLHLKLKKLLLLQDQAKCHLKFLYNNDYVLRFCSSPSGSIHIPNFPGFLTATKEDIQFVGSLTPFKTPSLII